MGLDPALIRPGRINKSLKLDYMKAEPLFQLMEHVMKDKLTEEQRARARRIANEGEVTPAKIEQSCGESESVDELLTRLETIAAKDQKKKAKKAKAGAKRKSAE